MLFIIRVFFISEKHVKQQNDFSVLISSSARNDV